MDDKLLKEVTKYGNGKYLLSDVLYYSSDRSVAQYKTMRRYPMCWLGLQFLKLGLADVPFTITGNNQEAVATATIVMRKIWKKLVREATECLDYGFKAFEIRYRPGEITYTSEEKENKFKGILFKQPKGLDGETIRILIEKDGSLRGFRQVIGLEQIDVLTEDRKCLLFTHNLESGQYYGMSALEPAYPFWYDANLNRRFHMRWLERKGTGFFKGIYPVGTSITENGERDNQDVMLDILDNMVEGNVIAIPSQRDEHGQLMWDVAFLNDSDKTDPFIARAKYIDEMILKALVIPEKALTQGEVGARASIEAFQDMFLQRKQAILDEIVSVINNYLLPHFVELNYGKNVELEIVAGRMSDATTEISAKIIQKLVEMDKVKVDKQWLVDRTGIPFDYKDEIVQEQDNHATEVEMQEPIIQNGFEIVQEQGQFWRPMNELEKKYNLTGLDAYIDNRQEQFLNEIAEELQIQIDRIKRYLDKNIGQGDYTKIVTEIEIKRNTIKRIIKSYLNDVYDYVIKNFEKAEMRFADTVSGFIGFRIDVVSEKLANDIEAAIKLQVANDIASGKGKIEVLDNISNITLHSFLTSRMPVIAETELGFILNRSVDDYIKSNLEAVKKGLIDEMKKITRVRYSAILDNKVCPFCQKMDGMVVEYGSAVYYRYNPPIHYNCRCVWLPITQEEIADPRHEYTDLTVNEKGRPISVEDIARKLGDDSLLKTFCECGA